MKKLILLFIVCLTFSYCKKETANRIPPPKLNPPVDNSYYKHIGKYTGNYINIVDNTDTLFVYTAFDVSNGDTGLINGQGGTVYSIYTKHIGEIDTSLICNTYLAKPYKYMKCGTQLNSLNLETSQGQTENYSYQCHPSQAQSYINLIPSTYYLNSTQYPYTAKVYFNYYPCGAANPTQITYNYKKL